VNAAFPLSQSIRAWRRFAAHNGLRVLAFCASFCVLLAAAVIYARDATPVAGGQGFAGQGGLAGAGRGARGLSIGVESSDPVARFAQTRVGHIVYSPSADDRCRRMLFDNRTGMSGDAGSVVCQRLAPESDTTPSDRLETLRKTFHR
jgi:hypothetical protein